MSNFSPDVGYNNLFLYALIIKKTIKWQVFLNNYYYAKELPHRGLETIFIRTVLSLKKHKIEDSDLFIGINYLPDILMNKPKITQKLKEIKI